MKEKSQFSLSLPPRRRKNLSADFEILFNAIATPALIVDPKSNQIILANHTIQQLTGYTLAEILDLDLRTLVSDWPEDLLHLDRSDTSQSIRISLNFSCRNQSTIDLILTNISNLEAGNGVVLTFDASPLDPHMVKSIIQGQFWKCLLQVVNSIEGEDMGSAIHIILESACLLTSSSAAMLYTASDQEPEFRQTASFGDSDWLPARVTSQDIKNIRTPRLWKSGKRSLSFLEQIAKVNEMSYLACTPIGYPTAIVGVLILADKRSDPPKALIEISSIIAALINLLILKQSYLTMVEGLNHKITDTVLQEEILLSNVKEGVIILNQTMDILQINFSAEQILGYRNQEVSGHPVKDVFADTDIILDAIAAVNSGSSSSETGNFYLYRRSGQSFMARINILPLVHDDYSNGAIILINDLSEEETIRKQTRQLEERAILGEIASVFAHEVRNPVNNISTGLELLSLTIDSNDPNLETISRLRKDCDRLAELMRSILAYSRSSEYTMTPVNLVQLINSLVDGMQIQIERAKVQVDLQADANCPNVLGNARALEQVFNNLISNALQAMSEKSGQLVLSINKVDPVTTMNNEKWKSLKVSVIDNGPGIPKDIQEHIFQPYFTTNQSGTGLGLPITKRIITAHRGTITLESFPGGTVFHVILPTCD